MQTHSRLLLDGTNGLLSPKGVEEYFRERSAIAWADQINTPVLILHSRADTKIPVSQPFAIAEKLQQYKKEYELVIYDIPCL